MKITLNHKGNQPSDVSYNGKIILTNSAGSSQAYLIKFTNSCIKNTTGSSNFNSENLN